MKIPHLLMALVAILPFRLHADSATPNYSQQLLSADEAFCAKAIKDGVLAAFLSVATGETKLLSETGKGFDAVKSGFKDFPPTATLSWKPSYAEASLAGDLGYTWGRYEYRDRKPDGKPIVESGTYVTVWRRQPDGSWKVVLDGGTADPKVQ
jgi:ketosteroid isomerase-like protein